MPPGWPFAVPLSSVNSSRTLARFSPFPPVVAVGSAQQGAWRGQGAALLTSIFLSQSCCSVKQGHTVMGNDASLPFEVQMRQHRERAGVQSEGRVPGGGAGVVSWLSPSG